jgi:small GTP-binding protein
MADDFQYDVFLSHSSKDKSVVRDIAERLRKDGLRVWFDEWNLKPGHNIQHEIDEGLEQSRVLILCMSANAFSSEWAHLEAGAFRFRDPLNKDLRFIPLRLDDAPIKHALTPFLYISWLPADRGPEYPKLLEACRLRATDAQAPPGEVAEKAIQLSPSTVIFAYTFGSDGKRVVTGSKDKTVRLWEVETGLCLCEFEGHSGEVSSVAWSANQRYLLSGSDDHDVRLWDSKTGRCQGVFIGHTDRVWSLAWGPGDIQALSGAWDRTVRVWDVETLRCVRVLEGHTNDVNSVAWSADGLRALSGCEDRTLRLWDVETGCCVRVFTGHTRGVVTVAWSTDQRRALSGSADNTVRMWDVETGRCLRVLEGHTGEIECIAWTADNRYALSGSLDHTVRVWDAETGLCLRVLDGHAIEVRSVAWSSDQRHAVSGDAHGGMRLWDLSGLITQSRAPETPAHFLPPLPVQVQYTNAKVLLVGDSSAGKTGLSMRLAQNDWKPSDSTVGAWATQWKLPVSPADGAEREIWLWDFGGQADQRLIHQLYMEDTALAVLVFDGQKEDLFESLGQWDRDLTRASRKPFVKILVAGRVDAGGLRTSRSQIEAFIKQRGFVSFHETSAKTSQGCEELKQAILTGIRWADIPWRSSPLLFKRLKEEIARFKDEGRALMRFNELRDALHLRLAGADAQFKDEELRAVVGLLAGPGVVWELAFGSWVLLQPERINAYAQAVIQTLRADQHERGTIAEERVLRGDLDYQSAMPRLEQEDERFVLLAMHQILLERGLCIREHTDAGPLLIFPSYYRRERPELIGHPAVLVSYRFNGFLDDIYATLVVRLHHTRPFQQDQLWRYAADFKTWTGKQLGVKLTRRAEGAGELDVYFDPAIPVEEKIIFSRYVHEHLLQKAQDVERLRHYVCPHCGTPAGNREVAMRKLMEGKKDIPCVNCEKRIPLWDKLEELFSSPEMQQRVRELQDQSQVVLDNESKERALVGEIISTVALAGQISREFNVSDHGIDMEIEFRDDAGKPTGKKVYLHLKSSSTDADYWRAQAFPVVLIVRTAEGEVRWIEASDWQKNRTFTGARFDAMTVRRWRAKAIVQ